MFKVVNWKTEAVYKTFATRRGALIAAGRLNADLIRVNESSMLAGYRCDPVWVVVEE